ncbi:uncharacterized protein LOC141914024 [Tubulanus polymorphus]|uniref:uncharacterized protein LOC141914024 n=1 Tax=Tubulanus polymorphus TaxID=672921 RepID=UPI003DA4B68E
MCDLVETGGNNSNIFLLLPFDILEKIIKYCTYEELSKYRLVCREFRDVCEKLLNHNFFRLLNQTSHHYQTCRSQMPRRESSRIKHPLMKECEIVETIHLRLTMLNTTFKKHIDLKHCCFFPGAILDEVKRLLIYVKTASNQPLKIVYKVTEELMDLSTMAIEYFKDVIEPKLPNPYPNILSENTTLLSWAGLNFGYDTDDSVSPQRSPPVVQQSNLTVKYERLRDRYKRLQRIYRSKIIDVSGIKRNLRTWKRKVTSQQRQINNLTLALNDQSKRYDSLVSDLHRSGCLLAAPSTNNPYQGAASSSTVTEHQDSVTPSRTCDIGGASRSNRKRKLPKSDSNNDRKKQCNSSVATGDEDFTRIMGVINTIRSSASCSKGAPPAGS